MSYGKFVNDLKDLKIKKRGQKPKVNPTKFYPSQIELQANEALLDELRDYAAKLKNAAQEGGVEAVYGVLGAPPESFKTQAAEIAEGVHAFQERAFANYSEMVVGERYFPSTEQKDLIISTWTENFVNLCKSTNEEMRKKSAGIISDAVLNGRNMNETVKELQNTCSDFSRSKAELIASTEIGKLNTAMNRAQSESAGIEYYEWAAAMDGRTRESHAVMDGRICKWGDDKGYYAWEVQPDGRRKLVRHDRPGNAYMGAPGTDFRCRCVALPYVPEYEDDYEESREKGPVRGVTQGEHADPETIRRNAAILAGKSKPTELQKVAERKKKESLAASQKKSMDVATGILRALKAKNPKISLKIMKPPYSEAGEYTLADEATIALSQKNSVERRKFVGELKMAKLMEDQQWSASVFIGEVGGAGVKNPDAVIDGIVSEYKHTEPTSGENAVSGNIRDALKQNARIIVLDVQSDLDYTTVWKKINGRLKGVNGVKVYFKLKGSDTLFLFKKK